MNNSDGANGGPHSLECAHATLCFALPSPLAIFQNPKTARNVTGAEREKEREKSAVNKGHYFPPATSNVSTLSLLDQFGLHIQNNAISKA